MDFDFTDEEQFEGINFTTSPLPTGTYELCTFTNCNFSATDLSNMTFAECVFVECNMNLVALTNTIFKDTTFLQSKLTGLRFDSCNDLLMSITVTECNLRHSSFYGVDLRDTEFIEVQLHDVDFSECNLRAAVFTQCDLHGAIFHTTNLEKADLRTSFNYIIDPELNNLKQARFSLSGLPGLLHKYDIEIE